VVGAVAPSFSTLIPSEPAALATMAVSFAKPAAMSSRPSSGVDQSRSPLEVFQRSAAVLFAVSTCAPFLLNNSVWSVPPWPGTRYEHHLRRFRLFVDSAQALSNESRSRTEQSDTACRQAPILALDGSPSRATPHETAHDGRNREQTELIRAAAARMPAARHNAG
jgi:hypothetical protein